MSTDERDEKINQLLHDAELADSGRAMATTMGDKTHAAKLREKYERLMSEANELDPRHQAPAWAKHAEWETRGAT